ncbi:Putative brain and reproductive organ-expressed p rotein [Trichuris trichiura]|uniref:BRISC and BRCA1-A complex member 2 n=1 Tax=Trichuris trichiura TaxID=36087 RepID=A0A077Z1L2_TRITR|nr:Putative brain and reproductive organ-expressed p rotein [Trichuris trichiura]
MSASPSTAPIETRKLALWLQPLVSPVVEHNFFDVFKAKIENVRSSASLYAELSMGSEPVGDRFRLVIELGRHIFAAEVTFVWSDPTIPPEFFFCNPEFDPPIEALSEYVNWDSNDHQCLLKLLCALFAKYREFQISYCYSYDALRRQIDSLMGDHSFDCHSNMFACLNKDTGEVGFIFRIPLKDIVELPAVLVPERDEHKAFLLVGCDAYGAHVASVEVLLSPSLDHFQNVITNVRLPKMNHTIGEYVSDVASLLKERQIVEFTKNLEMRTAFVRLITALEGVENVHIVEPLLNQVSYDYEYEDFRVRVTIDFPVDSNKNCVSVKVGILSAKDQGALPFLREGNFQAQLTGDLTPKDRVELLQLELDRTLSGLKRHVAMYMKPPPSYEEVMSLPGASSSNGKSPPI